MAEQYGHVPEMTTDQAQRGMTTTARRPRTYVCRCCGRQVGTEQHALASASCNDCKKEDR